MDGTYYYYYYLYIIDIYVLRRRANAVGFRYARRMPFVYSKVVIFCPFFPSPPPVPAIPLAPSTFFRIFLFSEEAQMMFWSLFFPFPSLPPPFGIQNTVLPTRYFISIRFFGRVKGKITLRNTKCLSRIENRHLMYLKRELKFFYELRSGCVVFLRQLNIIPRRHTRYILTFK